MCLFFLCPRSHLSVLNGPLDPKEYLPGTFCNHLPAPLLCGEASWSGWVISKPSVWLLPPPPFFLPPPLPYLSLGNFLKRSVANNTINTFFSIWACLFQILCRSAYMVEIIHNLFPVSSLSPFCLSPVADLLYIPACVFTRLHPRCVYSMPTVCVVLAQAGAVVLSMLSFSCPVPLNLAF